MFCSNCGYELEGSERVCPACGERVRMAPAHAVATDGPAVSQPARGSFEYARTTVANDLATVATDCYENMGWELTGSKAAGGHTTLSFRRSRKLKNKAQLVKIQRAMDDLIASIASFEGEKTRKATMISIGVGTVSALVLGVGMSCTMVWQQFMVLGIVVGLVGIAGCIAAWLLYRRTVAEETARIAPSIEAAYDRLATACEEAQTLLAV